MKAGMGWPIGIIAILGATKEAEDAWVDECNTIAHATLFTKIDSWINGANVEGKPVGVMFYMAGMGAYCDRLQQLVENDYEGFTVGSPSR